MTVKRAQSEMFDVSFSEVLKTIRAVLANGQTTYEYTDTVETDGGREFNTVIKPSQSGILSTDLKIKLYSFDTQTKVIVETKSQWFLFGDVADFYGSYIQEMLGSIRSGIGHNISTININREKPVNAPINLFLPINFVFIILLIGQAFLIRLIFNAWGLTGPSSSVDGIILRSIVQIIFILVVLIALVGFNYWWRKKYFKVLDPKLQMSMDFGHKMGRGIVIVVVILSVLFFVLRFVLK